MSHKTTPPVRNGPGAQKERQTQSEVFRLRQLLCLLPLRRVQKPDVVFIFNFYAA